jgi:SRSO17 transposase
VLIGRALYLPEGCAADDEHRELAGVPEEVLFATKPQLAGALLDCAYVLGIRAAFVAGDEVYGAAASCAGASASAGWATCWRSAPTTS